MFKKPVLVTGGAGFVGGYLVRHLSALGIPTIVIDDLSTGSLNNLPSKSKFCRFIKADIGNCAVISELVRESSLAVHFAAVVGMKNVVRNPMRTLLTNVNAVQGLAELCSGFAIPFVNISSSAVYRTDEQIADRAFKETDSVHTSGLHPSAAYAESKSIGELICDTYHRTRGLKCLIVRPFNLIGPRQVSDYGMVVPRFVQLALGKHPLPIHGDGKQTRTFSDVGQAVQLLWAVISSNDWSCQVVNLATNDHAMSIQELADLVSKCIGCSPKYSYLDHEQVYGTGYVDVSSRRPCLMKLRQLVGDWTPRPLTETIADIVKYESSRRIIESELSIKR